MTSAATPPPRARGVFIAGTDTGIGKTFVASALVRAHVIAGRRAIGMKPVASGCEETVDGLRNDDALALIDASSPAPAYADCNPFAFRAPISPHLAAAEDGAEITLAPIAAAYHRLAARAEIVVVEGVGGWLAPLSSTLDASALPRALGLPVLLVVGLRLGCLNHAQLTARAILADGANLIGWIGNTIDPCMLRREANRATLERLLPVPCLGVLPHGVDRDAASTHLDACRAALAADAGVASSSATSA